MKKIAAVLLPAVLLVSCGAPDQPAAATRRNGGEQVPLPEVDVWLSITDSIGVELGDSTLMFGLPAVAVRMPEDRIAVMDMQKHRVSIFNGGGDFITSVGRQGSGPGEFLLPSYLSVTPSGGLVVCDAMAGHLSFFDPGFQYTGSLTGFFPSPPVVNVFITDTTFVGMKPEYEQDDRGMYMGFSVSLWNISSPEPVLVYHRYLNPFDMTDMSGLTRDMVIFTADWDGSVYTSVFSTSEFLVKAWNPDGTLMFTITEPFSRIRKSDEDIESEREFIRNRMIQGGAPSFMAESYEPEPYRIAVNSLGIGPDLNLWVQLGVHNTPVFRVYDRDNGDYLYTAALEETDSARDMTVIMNHWGFTGVNQLSDDWPRVYLIEEI